MDAGIERVEIVQTDDPARLVPLVLLGLLVGSQDVGLGPVVLSYPMRHERLLVPQGANATATRARATTTDSPSSRQATTVKAGAKAHYGISSCHMQAT